MGLKTPVYNEKIKPSELVKAVRGDLKAGDRVYRKIMIGKGENVLFKYKAAEVLTAKNVLVVKYVGDSREYKLKYSDIVVHFSVLRNKMCAIMETPPSSDIRVVGDNVKLLADAIMQFDKINNAVIGGMEADGDTYIDFIEDTHVEFGDTEKPAEEDAVANREYASRAPINLVPVTKQVKEDTADAFDAWMSLGTEALREVQNELHLAEKRLSEADGELLVCDRKHDTYIQTLEEDLRKAKLAKTQDRALTKSKVESLTARVKHLRDRLTTVESVLGNR